MIAHSIRSKTLACCAAIACLSVLSGCWRRDRRDVRHEDHPEFRHEEHHEERHDDRR
jgi:hypothetical protein